ncbi:MAG: small multi-drug export protein [Clostridia bacterium]|nr:small multi-drug export protein [Clostridia bacterium]
MIPVAELRAAIPIGYSSGLNIWLAAAVSVIGNLLPVPFIIIFIRRIFAFIRRVNEKFNGFVTRLEKRAEDKSDIVKKYSFLGLFLLVAIPLPGTGAWTGALVAAMLDMRLKRALPAITAGVFTAAILVAFITCGADALFFG